MILLRQKKFSNPRVRKGVRAVGDSLVIARDNIYRALGIGNPIVNEQVKQEGRRVSDKVAAKIARMIPRNKKEFKLRVNNKKIKFLETADAVDRYATAHTPGDLISNATGEFVRRPFFVTSAAGGYVPLAWGIYVPGTTPASALGDATLRRLVPAYDNATRRLSERYQSGKLRGVIKDGIDKAYYLAQGAGLG